MENRNLTCVVGEVKPNETAVMRFYGPINEESTRQFNEEFLFIQDCIKPAKIIVSINSEGGSVLYGMSTFSIIQQCPIEVETVIEGIAASMGSVLWAAGKRSYMRDYSILMIHNPFIRKNGDMSADDQMVVNAFSKQIEMIYHKRFGLAKSKVREIMTGKEGCDGTYFDAQEAVAAGIIPAENVIKTSKQLCTEVKQKLEGVSAASEMRQIIEKISMKLTDVKPTDVPDTIHNQNQTNNLKTMNGEQGLAFGSVCAQLGFDKSTDASVVFTRIAELKNAEAKWKEAQAALDALKIQKEGVDAQLTNVQNELKTAKDELNKYKEAEHAKRQALIEQLVDDAIKDGKITGDAKPKWVEMAQSNLEMVQATLDSIPKRDKISEQIATDPINVQAAKDNLTEAEKKMAEAVEAIVGKDFKFQVLD